MSLLRDIRFAAANPAAADFTQLKAWTCAHGLAGEQVVDDEFAWAKRGVRLRTAELIWRLRHGRPSATEEASRRYDVLTVEAMRRVLRPDSNCIDIGAAAAEILRFIEVLAPEGNHHAFEPIPYQASELRLQFP